ncbi:MAG: hypothetical protein KAX38_06525 [Candidatus Krumholzibacteria bacterium]|nr:hypothetical protein [Candidatus Krumholzibacteria bacterium]
MRKYLVLFLVLILLVWSGCKPKHPSEVFIDPGFNPNMAGDILVAPFFSSVSEGEDPERESEKVMNRVLWEKLSERTDHNFIATEQFKFALIKAKLTDRLEAFKDTWTSEHRADKDFLQRLSEVLDVELVLIPHVYLWYKDETDFRAEVASSTTQVGATLTLINIVTGRRVWEATDENYKEAVRSEGERVMASTGGVQRRVHGITETGRDMYAAPPYEDVAITVLEVLISEIPVRGSLK